MPKMTLRALRVNAGYTQKEVAKKMNKSNKTISSWENGESFPDPAEIDMLCDLYGVSYDHINFLPNNSLKAN